LDEIHLSICARWIHRGSGPVIDTIELTCTKNGQKKTADVMQHDDKYIKCVVEGTQIAIELFRDDVNIPYTGHTAGLEFEWQPKN
jgi:hypothetical protein